MSFQVADYAPHSEWLEADGQGGFASGTLSGVRSRRYHALLVTATAPPVGRVVLVNGFEAWLTTQSGRYALTSQRYYPDVLHPDGAERLRKFEPRPWPTWTFACEDGSVLTQELVVVRDQPATLLRWRLTPRSSAQAATTFAKLEIRLLLSGRDFHALQRENPHFDFTAHMAGNHLVIQAYPELPRLRVTSNASYAHAPCWYRNFHYVAEQERGLDHIEDLASPGILTFDLDDGAAWLALAALPVAQPEPAALQPVDAASASQLTAEAFAEAWEAERQRRLEQGSGWQAAADAYIVRRGAGETLIAGYPWFGDWGRDTFIALRGLCLARGQTATAGRILEQWSEFVSEGMLPNRFPDASAAPEYNSVDASLWYVIAVHDYLQCQAAHQSAQHGIGSQGSSHRLQQSDACVDQPRRRQKILTALSAILRGYTSGTRFQIRMAEDGLLACGTAGLQLTWMDAKVGAWVVTPRIGKPVEVQALWLNALHIAAAYEPQYAADFERGLASFRTKFWNAELGALYDVIDVEQQPGRVDASLRPNQILAVGGLPLCLLDAQAARSVVNVVESKLLTPLGLRTLGPTDPNYHGQYAGGVTERDAAYHQGTAWPWLLGPFVEAWLRVHGSNPETRALGRQRFLTPLFEHLNEAGLGHVSEIVDGAAPHRPAGAPFQAWSLGEMIRLERLLSEDD